MTLDLTSLKQALSSLNTALNRANDNEMMSQLDIETQKVIQAGVIQNFEFSYELCWKFMKRWLQVNIGHAYVDGVTRRELFRLATENQLINQIEHWFEYHEARNRTSHTYQLSIAQEVFDLIPQFHEDAQYLLNRLIEKND